jgi:hypothetical protein
VEGGMAESSIDSNITGNLAKGLSSMLAKIE